MPTIPLLDCAADGSEIEVHHRGVMLPVSSRVALVQAAAVVATLSLCAMAGAALTPGMAREFRAADTQAEDYPTVQALRYMGSLISERTGGRDRIRVFHSRQLGEEKETIE